MSGPIVFGGGTEWTASSGVFNWVVDHLANTVADQPTRDDLRLIAEQNFRWLDLADLSDTGRRAVLAELAANMVAHSGEHLPVAAARQDAMAKLAQLADLARVGRAPTGRRAARAILIDHHERLVLLRRTKPGQQPYWTTPGGGVEDTDPSVEAALHRELAEELGAAVVVSRVFLFGSPPDVQHFFLARLATLDESARTGPEFADPSRGRYDVDRIDLRGDDLVSVDLRPTELKDFVLANREALLTEVASQPDD